MGWSSGSGLFAEVAEAISNHVKDENDRKAIYEAIVEAFEDYDCDTLYECIGEIDHVLDEVLEEKIEHEDNEDFEEDID